MRSFINPEVINKNKGASPEAFSTFMLGRKGTIGSSVLNSAKNKIVNFDRAAVKPISSNAPGVISSISTNVTNNSTTNVSNANNFSTLAQRLSQNVNTTLSTFINNTKNQTQNIIRTVQTQFKNSVDALTDNIKRDYQQKVQSIENTRPFSVLKKFLDLYKNAVNFITYFGDEKNFKRIRVALKTLRRIFDESFNIATLVRQVIVKIVRQLSNLPTASGNAPDLSLDLKVPGGALKQQGGSSIGKFARSGLGKAVGFGAAAGLGIGAAGVGAEALSGMSKAEQFQEEKLRSSTVTGAESQSSVSEGFLSGMERIIDTFSNAVNDLIKFVTERSKQQPSASPSPGASPESPPPDGNMADVTVSPEIQTTGLKSNFAPIAQDILNTGKIDTTKLSERAAMGAMLAVGQMESNYSYDQAYSGLGGENMNMMGFLQLNRAYHKVQGKEQYLDYTIPVFKGEKTTFSGKGKFNPLIFAEKLRTAETGWDVAQALTSAGFTRTDFDPLDTAEEANRLTRDQVQALKKIVFGNLNIQERTQINQNITGIQTGGQTPSTRPSQVSSQGPQSRASEVSPGTPPVAAVPSPSGYPQPEALAAVPAPRSVIVPLPIGTPPSSGQHSGSFQPIGGEASTNIAYLHPSNPSNPGWPYAPAHLGIT